MLETLLRRRFGNVPDWVEKRLLDADGGLLEDWAVKVLDAKSLEEIFFADASPASASQHGSGAPRGRGEEHSAHAAHPPG